MVDTYIQYRLENYETLKGFIYDIIPKTARILVIGCGNAEFSEKMFDDGFEHIDNIDLSEVVITQMKARNVSRKSMTYATMDARDLRFADSTYDLVFDKCLLDSILCGEKAFYNASLITKVRICLVSIRKYKECLRVMVITC